jgi:hypothetical protein
MHVDGDAFNKPPMLALCNRWLGTSLNSFSPGCLQVLASLLHADSADNCTQHPSWQLMFSSD